MTDLEVYQDPHRSRDLILAGIASAVAVGFLLLLPQLHSLVGGQHDALARVVVMVLAGASGVFGVRIGMEAAFAGLEKRQTIVASRNLLSWALYVLLLVMLATAAGINLSAVLVAGGILSVIAAITAQSTLSNFFAGLMLLVVRPYRMGDSVYLRSWSYGGVQYEGLIVDIGSLYTTLSSNGELFRIPNSSVIGSVLVPDYKPVRADVVLRLPSGMPLGQLEEKIKGRLRLRPGARIFLMPNQYAVQEGQPQMTVRLLIKADEWLSADNLMGAIDSAVREVSDEEPKPRLVDASDRGPG